MIEVTAAIDGDGPNLTSQILRRPVDRIKRQLKRLTHDYNRIPRLAHVPGDQFLGGVRRGPGSRPRPVPRARRRCSRPAGARSAAKASAVISSRARACRRCLELAGRGEPGPVRVQAACTSSTIPSSRGPFIATVVMIGGFQAPGCALPERDHGAQVPHHLVAVRLVRLVHHEQVRHLEDAGLGRLDRVAHPRREQHDHGVRERGDRRPRPAPRRPSRPGSGRSRPRRAPGWPAAWPRPARRGGRGWPST